MSGQPPIETAYSLGETVISFPRIWIPAALACTACVATIAGLCALLPVHEERYMQDAPAVIEGGDQFTAESTVLRVEKTSRPPHWDEIAWRLICWETAAVAILFVVVSQRRGLGLKK